MLPSEIVYEYSHEAQCQLNIACDIMTFTQPSLKVFLGSYLATFDSVDAMKNRTIELFDMFVMPCKVNNYYPECRKPAFRQYINNEIDSRGLAGILAFTPDAFGKVHADSESI